MKIYIMIISLILMLGLVNAGTPQEPDDYIKLANTINYKQPCINNGTYCSTGAICNITATYPNGTIFISNQKMTNNYNYHNYTFDLSEDCNTFCGIYKFDIVCTDNGLSGTKTFYAEMNPTGIRATDQRTNAISRSIYMIFGIAILCFIAFIFFQHPAAKYSFVTLAAILFVAGINISFASLRQEVVSPDLINFFDFFSAASYYFYWLGGGLIMIFLIVTTFSSIYERYSKTKLMKYGGDEKAF